jgi:hypothetical protein
MCHRVLRQSQVERIVKKRARAGKPRFIPNQSDDEGVDARELVPVFLLLVWISIGCIYGVKVEGFEPVTALYFSVTSLSTGDLRPPLFLSRSFFRQPPWRVVISDWFGWN